MKASVEMNVSTVIIGLTESKTPSELTSLFKKFGDLLREETVRSSQEVEESITLVTKIAISSIETFNKESSLSKSKEVNSGEYEALLLENFRVLINILADNDRNRRLLIDTVDLQFWAATSEFLGSYCLPRVSSRIVLFLTQFIYNTSEKKSHVSFFVEHSIDDDINLYLTRKLKKCRQEAEIDFPEFASAIELYSEMVTDKSPAQLDVYLELFIFLLDQKLDRDDDDLEYANEIYSNSADIIYSITSLENAPSVGADFHQKVFMSIAKIPGDVPNATLIKRKLFASSGNITSVANYDTVLDIFWAVDYFKNGQTLDPYILAACAVAIGNYVTSKEKRVSLTESIENRLGLQAFVTRFHHIKFNDVIQYQAFHMLNNLMSVEVALVSLQNTDSLLSSCKVIVDNGQYYKEVLDLYCKYIKKLIRCAYIDQPSSERSLFSLADLWSYFENSESKVPTEEIFLLLCQAFTLSGEFKTVATENIPFVRKILGHLTADTNFAADVSSPYLLEKLKTLGIFFQNMATNSISGDLITIKIYNGDPDQYTHKFLAPYYCFLQKLQRIIAEAANSSDAAGASQFKVIENNSKFVCASTISWLELSPTRNELVDSIFEVCHTTIR